MPEPHDIVIIGAGHNGLVTAYYLARAGFKPLLLERRPVVGGAAITEEFHPGFTCSTLAHVSGPLRPDIFKDMQLDRHGLQMIQPDPRLFAPSPEGRALILYSDPAKSAQEIAKFSRKEAEKYLEFQRVLGRMAKVISQLLKLTPPSIDNPTAGDLWNLLKTFKGFRSLGRQEMLRLLRWGPMAVADLVAEWFETQLLRATIAARGIFGNFLGPCSPGTSAVLLLRAAADGHPAGTAAFARQGMGTLTQAMASAARQAGAEIRTGADVARIMAKGGSVTGVVLATGEALAAKTVISNADPRRTFLRLLDPIHLEPDFVVKLQNYHCLGTTAKVNLALAGLPTFTALQGAAAPAGSASHNAALAGRIHIGPDIEYLERAFDDAKYGDFSRQPYLDITIPSLADPSLAPAGRHVMSIYMQFAPFELKSGDWNSRREALGNAVVETLSAYAPTLPSLILQRQVITPHDLEQTYGLTGGHIFHGELALDQLFTMRPLLGWARYRTPIKGLYLCGSGTHPGSGLTGASGANAAREILKNLRR
ncbi:MAG: phytoene desaturase family protein [Terriglobia bacterium]